MNHDVFISYSSRDKATALAICHVLEEHRIRCWMAPRDIPVGADYGDVIDEAIVACRLFVLVFSEPASLSQWVKGEVNLAFTEKKIILPYRIDTAPLKGAMRLILNQMHWVEAYPDAESKFGELVESAERFLGRPADSAAAAAPAVAAAPAPSAAPARTNAAAAPAAPPAEVPSTESGRPEAPVSGTVLSAAPVAEVPAAVRRYEVGDYYDVDGKRGIVFEVDASGGHGKIIALRDAGRSLKWQVRTDTLFVRTIGGSCDDGAEVLACVQRSKEWEQAYPAFAYCSSLGRGWYLPTLEELRTMQELRNRLSEACVEHGGEGFATGRYWSCYNNGRAAMAIVFATGYVFDNDKSSEYDVRAVAAF